MKARPRYGRALSIRVEQAKNQILYIGMKKSQIDSKRLVKADDEYTPKSMKSYHYEGINMWFHNNILIFMHVSETSQEGRFHNERIRHWQ